jgi:hypothetical protein
VAVPVSLLSPATVRFAGRIWGIAWPGLLLCATTDLKVKAPASDQNAESGVDRGSDSGVEVEARIGSYVRSSQCCIDPSNGQSPVV